uniref:Uncharacterized protein n=1 Tax=Anguilla anguilla TaxID=7936 RepID=A0A0E9V590_ANGAN
MHCFNLSKLPSAFSALVFIT